MGNVVFPPIEYATPEGVVAISYEIDTDYLIAAYSNGIFPWPFDDEIIPWVSPPQRAVLEFRNFKIPKSLPRFLKKQDFYFRINTAFEQVIRACSAVNRPHQDGTWINRKIIESYCDFHRLGYAVSFETFDAADCLVGGLYGVRINRYFAGESMFFLRSGASKFALIEMIRYFREQDMTWIDVQVMTPLMKSFGATEISRSGFMKKLRDSL